jgi:hypothetical protein
LFRQDHANQEINEEIIKKVIFLDCFMYDGIQGEGGGEWHGEPDG